MKKKKLLLSSLLMLMSIGMAHGQAVTAYVYVQQSNAIVEADGIASVDISSTEYTLSFEGDNAVMKQGDVIVATLPINSTSNGELVASTALPSGKTAGISATVGSEGYATYYSPFRLAVGTGDVKAYAPTYDESTNVLACTEATNVNGKVIPAGTGLLLKNAGTLNFTVATDGTAVSQGYLSGSAIQIDKSTVTVPDGNVIYTLGYKTGAEQTAANFGFYEYTGENLNPAKAYLIAAKLNPSSGAREYIGFDYGEGVVTGINNVDASHSTNSGQASSAQARNGKYIESGRVVIVKNNRKYNLNGQEVK